VSSNETAELTEQNGTVVELTEPAAEHEDAAQPEDTAEPEERQRQKRDGIVRRSARVIAGRVGAILLTVALLASAGAAAWIFFQWYRPDQQTNDAAAAVALDAAKTGTVAMLSYAPESLDKDFANAKSHLTGDFLSYYTNFTQQIVTPAAKQKAVKTSAAVVRAAVSEMHPDSAVVLVFINQNTTSKENPDGAFAASAVKVGLKKINGTWLISAFDPV
jgi:Mce-associated membrane protein